MFDVVIPALQHTLLPTPGLAHPPTTPVDSINEYPAMNIYPATGSYAFGSANGGRGVPMITGTHNVQVDIHVSTVDTDETFYKALGFDLIVPQLLFAAWADRESQFRQAVLRFQNLRYEFRKLGFGSDNTFGWRFILELVTSHGIPVVGEEQ